MSGKKVIVFVMLGILLYGFMPLTSARANTADTSITIDGYYDDWSGLPYSWEYNWDNPYRIENYWDGTKNITKEYRDENGNQYNLEIRHKMSLYCDGTYIYLHIEIASNYTSAFNGDDYQLYVDGQMARFRLTYPGGGTINKNNKIADGIYAIEIRHEDSAISGSVVNGAVGMYTRKANDLNNEVELKIPLTELKSQNKNIDIKSFHTISFFTPNLMYRKITCAGTSTGPYAGIVLCLLVVFGTVMIRKHKKGANV